MVEHLQSVSQVTSWLVAWRTLFIIIHILGVAGFAYIVAKRLVPLLRAERDFRFDQPLARLRKSFQILAGAVEASALQDRRDFTYSYFRRIHSPGDACLHGADCRRIPEFRDARPFRKGRRYLRHNHGLRCDRRLPLHGSCRCPPAGLQTCAICSAGEVRQGHTADAVFLLGLIAILMVADSLFAAANAAGQAQQGQPVEALAFLSLPWIFKSFFFQLPWPLSGKLMPVLIFSTQWPSTFCCAIGPLEFSFTSKPRCSTFTSPSWIAGF